MPRVLVQLQDVSPSGPARIRSEIPGFGFHGFRSGWIRIPWIPERLDSDSVDSETSGFGFWIAGSGADVT